MNVLNKENLKSILKPFKEKMDSCITEEQLKSELDNYVTEDNATINNSLSIKNNDNDTIATLSAEQNSVKLSIGDNIMALNTDGELLVNNVNVLSNNSDNNNLFPSSIKYIDDNYTRMPDLPFNFSEGTAVAVGTDIYLLGSFSYKSKYKYNTLTNTYTKLAVLDYSPTNGDAVNIGNFIYLVGCKPSNNSHYIYNYKYDIATDTCSKLADIPYDFKNGSAVAIGNDIYLLGPEDCNSHSYNYKYDTLTNTYSKNKDIPYYFENGSAVAIGKKIYLLGSSDKNAPKNNYKYDPINDSYTKLADIPYSFKQGSAIIINNDIYLLGTYDSAPNKVCGYNYKYDTINDTYSINTQIPYEFYNGDAVVVGNDIFILGGENDYVLYNYKYTIPHNRITISKKSNYYIYTEFNKSYGPESCIVEIADNEYYTEYNNKNEIIKSTYPISSDGTTKMYIKQGAILNGKTITVSKEGWQTINILDYI